MRRPSVVAGASVSTRPSFRRPDASPLISTMNKSIGSLNFPDVNVCMALLLGRRDREAIFQVKHCSIVRIIADWPS